MRRAGKHNFMKLTLVNVHRLLVALILLLAIIVLANAILAGLIRRGKHVVEGLHAMLVADAGVLQRNACFPVGRSLALAHAPR